MEQTTPSSPAERPRPYRGLPPFRTEDRHLFFGRDEELAAIEAMVRAEPFTLLHASSGAGKSSLINAGLLPRLEEHGLLCVVARPFDDPPAVLIGETLARVLPAPRLEAEALRRAVAALDLDETQAAALTLKSLRAKVDAIPLDDSRYLEVRGPLRIEPSPAAPSGEVTPFAVRFLVGTGRPTLFARQIEAFARFARWPVVDALGIEIAAQQPFVDALADVTVNQLIAFFEDERIGRVHMEVIRNLTAGPTTDRPTLLHFFDLLTGLWGSAFDEFSLVIILDQFEELFTRFKRIQRQPYFGELQGILPRAGANTPLPLRILISMREDHAAELDELEALTGPIPLNARYRLHLMDRKACELAVSQPAVRFRTRIEDSVLGRLVNQLVSDDDEVLPSHLQVVCSRIFDEPGFSTGSGEQQAEVAGGLGWVAGILSRFFNDFLVRSSLGDDPAQTDLDRIEMLDLLEPMITLGERRNIVERNQLICAPFRRPQRRRLLLERMSEHRLVRTEYRHNLAFVEITHEFLIPAIREALRLSHGERLSLKSLRSAFNRLKRIEDDGPRNPWTEPPDEQEYSALWEYRGRLYIQPEPEAPKDEMDLARPWVPEVLLRTAVQGGRNREHIRYWADSVNAVRSIPEPEPLATLETLSRSGGLVGIKEVKSICAAATPQALDARQLKTLARSAIVSGDPELVRSTVEWIWSARHAET